LSAVVAEPSAVANCTVVAATLGADWVTVNVKALVPALPSP
jgi:hypothetical protein